MTEQHHGNSFGEEEFNQMVIESLALALMRLTCSRKGEAGSVRRRISRTYPSDVLASLRQQGHIALSDADDTLELTDTGFFFGDVFAARFGMTLVDALSPHGEPADMTGNGAPPQPTFSVIDGGTAAKAPAHPDMFAPVTMDQRPNFDPKETRREHDTRAFRLRIELDLEDLHPCWREIEIPATCTFLDLHIAIQRIFNWYDEHLFSFQLTARGQKLHIEQACFLDPSLEVYEPASYAVVEADAIRLGDVFPRTRKARYAYDYGDGWEHKVKVVKTIANSTLIAPQLVDGQGDAPPEDVGGIGGFEHFLQVAANPAHPEHHDLLAWADAQMAYPFDLTSKKRELEDCWEADRALWNERIQGRHG